MRSPPLPGTDPHGADPSWIGASSVHSTAQRQRTKQFARLPQCPLPFVAVFAPAALPVRFVFRSARAGERARREKPVFHRRPQRRRGRPRFRRRNRRVVAARRIDEPRAPPAARANRNGHRGPGRGARSARDRPASSRSRDEVSAISSCGPLARRRDPRAILRGRKRAMGETPALRVHGPTGHSCARA